MLDRNLHRQKERGKSRGELKVPRRTVKPKRKRLKLRWFIAVSLLGGSLGYFQFKPPAKPPEAVLVLGGEPQRERFAATFAQQHPGMPIWVSGGSNPEYADWIFQQAGISKNLVHLDYDAVDTMTNFTTIVDKLRSQGIDSIYLITSDYHMRRARWIGQVILGSRGIHFESVAIPSQKPPESLKKAAFDGARAVLWVITGNTGEFLKQEFH
ncbi:MAG: YdcF family protein [Acaryochloridaceae cyanobacterium RU_4_10]|nr:YdcF family protein [Acaryochloridaceae cyanobacterium RU_4_10]